MEAAAPRILADKYEVLGRLGEGGTGVVYDAVRITDGAPVALKVMHPGLAGDQQIRGRFRREEAILRRLEGPHVCKVFELGEVPGEDETTLLYIALQKVDGPSLSELLAKGFLPVDRAIAIVLQVLEALGAAHSQGVIHRDLKPANVLLQSGDNVVVADFGLSKIVTGAGIGTTNLTTHNMMFGTPEYMSPEQARGDELDPRCDVYAAGVMLYEVLTGAPPFTGPSPLSVLTAHLTSDLEPPSQRPGAAERVTPALEAVVVKALARERLDRYSSATELARALERATRGTKPSSSHAKIADAFAETLKAPTTSPLVDVGAATMISDRPPGVSTTPRSSRRPTPAPPPRAPSPVPVEDPANKTWILLWIAVAIASIAVGVWVALRT